MKEKGSINGSTFLGLLKGSYDSLSNGDSMIGTILGRCGRYHSGALLLALFWGNLEGGVMAKIIWGRCYKPCSYRVIHIPLPATPHGSPGCPVNI